MNFKVTTEGVIDMEQTFYRWIVYCMVGNRRRYDGNY